MTELTLTERFMRKQSPEQMRSAKEKKVMEVFNKMVNLINQEINLYEFKNLYFPDEDRTLEFNIKEFKDLDTGLVFKDGKVRTMKKLQDPPTCIFTCNESTFLLMATGELSFPAAYMWGNLDIDGEKALRDYEIFKRMFNKYGHLLRKIKNGG